MQHGRDRGSTHDADRTFSSAARESVDLLDHLGPDRVRVLGLSGGGPHALAVAAIAPGRVMGVDGAVHEGRRYTRPWGFDLAAVVAPVRLWYGDQDGMAPAAMGRRLARRLRHATLTVVPDRAHLSVFVREAERFLLDPATR